MSLIDKANELLSRWEKEVCTLPVPEDFPNNVLMCIAGELLQCLDNLIYTPCLSFIAAL